VSRDLAHDVHLDPGIGDPGESCVPEVMAAHVLVAELGDDVVPVGDVAQDRGGNTAAPRPGEQADDRGRRPDGETSSASSRATRPAAVRRQQ
jgi:hypothetical protein